MKKKYYAIFSISIAAILLLQSTFIASLYQNFILAESQNIEESIHQAIDLELHNREANRSNVKYTIRSSHRPFNSFNQEEQDSLIEIYPFLAAPPSDSMKTKLNRAIPERVLRGNSYDIRALMDRGIIRSRGDIETQTAQDKYIENGEFINVNTLDSLFRYRLNRSYITRTSLLDSQGGVISIVGDSVEYNYTCEPIPIGLKATHNVVVDVKIRPSRFITSSIAILILSIIVVMIPLLSLLYFVIVLRRREVALRQRETSIGGIIHDLKTPLVGVATMLDCYSIIETDESKRSYIKENRVRITHLSKRIDRLLYAAKDSIKIVKETMTEQGLRERVEIMISDLKRQYSGKSPQITISYQLQESLNIDTLCLDSIFVNIVENALKYTLEPVKIDINIKQIDSTLTLWVRDNGIGIDRSKQRDIFKYLYQINDIQVEGYGIGLAYVRALSRAHGGDVTLIESCVNRGSTFEAILNIE